MNRRESLKSLGLLTAAYALPSTWAHMSNEDAHPDYPWINQKWGPRPDIGWISGEELAYHEVRIKSEWQKAPEFYPFFDQPAITNRQWVWKREQGFTFVYTECEKLLLTGEKSASTWLSEPANRIESTGRITRFLPHSGTRLREAMVLSSFQFNISQHPTWQAEITCHEADYQLVISIKGRAGIPLYHSAWCRGKHTFRLSITEWLRKKGYTLNYGQVHVALVVWKESLAQKPVLDLQLWANTKPAVLFPLPVICWQNQVPDSLPLLSLGVRGTPQSMPDGWRARVNGKDAKPSKNRLTLPTWDLGTCVIESSEARWVLRVTDRHHWNLNQQGHWQRRGQIVSPLTGTYSSIVHVAQPGKALEKFLHTEADYLETPQGERHYHFWESLTESELSQRFAFLASQGLDVVHMSQGWGFWQKLDAGGKISPFAAELFAQYYRLAAEHGMQVVQALSHYPYYRKTDKQGWGTPPHEAYFQAGLTDSDWAEVGDSPFQRLFEEFLRDFGRLFAQETALMLLSTSGEGDQKAYADRCNWVEQKMAQYCPNTVFYSEPIHIFYKKVSEHTQGWNQKLIGSRTYSMGALIRSDADLQLYFRLNRMDSRIFMAEGAFPAPELYSRFQFREGDDRRDTWLATDFYRRHVRDNLYMGLVYGMPMMLTWEEQFTENERLVLREIRRKLDQAFIPTRPQVEVLFTEEYYKNRRQTLGPVAERAALEAWADYQLVDAFSGKARLEVDTGTPLGDQIWSAWSRLSPFQAKGNYSYAWAQSQDQKWLMIYAYNTAGMHTHEVLYGKYHRLPKPADAFLKLDKVYSGTCWNLDTRQAKSFKGDQWNLSNNNADYLLLLEVS